MLQRRLRVWPAKLKFASLPEGDTALPDALRLRIAEAGLLALRFHLRVLSDALPTAVDDGHELVN
ncbi:MAG: hypothetical protein DMG36_16280 [Acidobacteria bacterium]|nr:MAG: hypothetical protein DMG36_16280 [Acidobacteriota bacterium]